MRENQGPERILIACAGLGMGNASRISAVLESLGESAKRSQRDIEFHVCSWGPGYRFLSGFQQQSQVIFDLTELQSYPTAHSLEKAFSPRTLYRYLRTYFLNVKTLRKLIRKQKPNLIILDSDYHFPAYFLSRSPIVFIGQAVDVLDRAKAHAFHARPWMERLNLYVRERLDSLIQIRLSRLVLVPSFTNAGACNQNVAKIPLITRKEFNLSAPSTAPATSIGVLLSGSEIEQEEFLSAASQHQLQVMSPSGETVPSRAALLDRFDVILTQGGLSSISECVARGRFVVVFPMRQHPEQMLNALEVERLGLGMHASQEDLHCLPKLLERVQEKRANSPRFDIACNGAEVAAEAITKILWTSSTQIIENHNCPS